MADRREQVAAQDDVEFVQSRSHKRFVICNVIITNYKSFTPSRPHQSARLHGSKKNVVHPHFLPSPGSDRPALRRDATAASDRRSPPLPRNCGWREEWSSVAASTS